MDMTRLFDQHYIPNLFIVDVYNEIRLVTQSISGSVNLTGLSGPGSGPNPFDK